MVPPRITLLTDFGTADGYVGAMKGVIASILPDARIDDISHDIVPGDIAAAAWCVGTYWDEYPRGTVHVCVVDPGVGGARRAVAAELDGRVLVAPDNGVLTRAVAAANARRIVEIAAVDPPGRQRSATFHGRDVFAPAAAHLAGGMTLDSLGPIITEPVGIALPVSRATAGGHTGEVVHVDRFGNLITNIPGGLVSVGSPVLLECAPGCRIVMRTTYSDVAAGEVVAVTGSAGLLEIAVRDGNAAQRLAAGRGAVVRVGDDVGRGTRSP